MRRLTIYLIVPICILFSCKNRNDVDVSIVPEIDERIELMSILARIADYEEYNDSTYLNYVTDIEESFAPFSDAGAVLTLRELRSSTNLAYDGIMNMAVNLDISDNGITPIEDITRKDDRWPSVVSERFYGELTNFYNISNFHEWFNSNRDIYGEIVSNAHQIAEVNDDWFNEFFGYKNPHEFKLIIGPGNGYGNYGPSSQSDGVETIYAIVGVGDIDQEGNALFYEDELGPTVVHEFLHSYINPFTRSNISKLSTSADNIYGATIDEMNKLAYGDGETVINESLVRACVIQYMNDNGYKKEEIIFESIYNKRIGFYWITGLVNSINTYKKNRDKYPQFTDYAIDISEFFNSISQKSDVLKQEFEKTKASVIKTSPERNMIVSHETNEISFTLDQPLLKEFYGFGPVYKQAELFPEYSDEDNNFIYSEDEKTITITNVSLLPNKSYRIKLVGNMTCTQEGNTSSNYELVFKTN